MLVLGMIKNHVGSNTMHHVEVDEVAAPPNHAITMLPATDFASIDATPTASVDTPMEQSRCGHGHG